MALTTWTRALADPSISLMEHPVMPILLTKDEMEDELGPVLAYLDGSTMCDTVHMFYRRDSVDASILRFCDEDAKMDIFDWAVDEGCLPHLHQIHSGDDLYPSPPSNEYGTQAVPSLEEELAAELARVRKQTADQKARRNAPKQTIRKHGAPILAQICGRRKALVKLRDQFNQVVNEGVRAHLASKIVKAEDALQKLVWKSGKPWV